MSTVLTLAVILTVQLPSASFSSSVAAILSGALLFPRSMRRGSCSALVLSVMVTRHMPSLVTSVTRLLSCVDLVFFLCWILLLPTPVFLSVTNVSYLDVSEDLILYPPSSLSSISSEEP